MLKNRRFIVGLLALLLVQLFLRMQQMSMSYFLSNTEKDLIHVQAFFNNLSTNLITLNFAFTTTLLAFWKSFAPINKWKFAIGLTAISFVTLMGITFSIFHSSEILIQLFSLSPSTVNGIVSLWNVASVEASLNFSLGVILTGLCASELYSQGIRIIMFGTLCRNIVAAIGLHLNVPAETHFYISVISTIAMILVAAHFLYKRSRENLDELSPVTAKLSIFFSYEFVIGLIRITGPFLASALISKTPNTTDMLTSFQLSFLVAYILALPPLVGNQILLRDLAGAISKNVIDDSARRTLATYFKLCLGPSVLLLTFSGFAIPILSWTVLNYKIPSEQLAYLVLYMFACAIGQIGNFLVTLGRAKGMNARITINFLIIDYVYLLTILFCLKKFDLLSPLTIGLAYIGYCCLHVLLSFTLAPEARLWALKPLTRRQYETA